MRLTVLAAWATGIVAALACAPAAAAAEFDYHPKPAVTGLVLTFESAGLAPEEEDEDVSWDFDGDGVADATGRRPSWRFMRPGTYRVTMSAPASGTASLDVPVGQLPAPFITYPASIAPGQDVLVVYSGQTGSGAPLERYDWELDGDGDFNDASGIVLHRTFPAAGEYLIGLRVTDKDGAFGTEFHTVSVRSAATVVPSALRLLSPYPIVRLTGRVIKSGALIRRLTVQAPVGASITIRCRGRGCPFKQSTRTARRSRAGSKRATATVRFRKLERRRLRGGATIRVFVTRQGWVGKYTRWTIRRGKPPLRRDRCLTPGVPAPSACPST
jgi:hypothetical protein